MMWTIGAAFICLAVALVIATTVMLIVRSKLKSVRSQHAACNYERPGSFGLTVQKDMFLYRNITRIPRPKK